MSRTSTIGGLLLAAAAGLLLSLYGPTIPELQERFGVGGGASGPANDPDARPRPIHRATPQGFP